MTAAAPPKARSVVASVVLAMFGLVILAPLALLLAMIFSAHGGDVLGVIWLGGWLVIPLGAIGLYAVPIGTVVSVQLARNRGAARVFGVLFLVLYAAIVLTAAVIVVRARV